MAGMSGRCKDCRHWRKNVEPNVLSKTSTCLRVEVAGEYSTALLVGTTAVVTPGGARLHTGPEFGCVQWEAKR